MKKILTKNGLIESVNERNNNSILNKL